VKRVEGQDLVCDLGKTEARISKKEQSKLESFSVGDRIRCVIKTVEKAGKNAGVVVSRGAPDLVMRLFEQEVPEIYDNTVVIKGCAREAGERTKIAVSSRDRDVDSVGACVGMKGMRVQSIIRELRGEKIDIIPFSEDIMAFAQKSLSPAKVTRVQIVDPENHHLEVIVEDTQLSLAIGKKGQNVRLASKLIGWNVDIKSEEEKRQEIEAQMAALTAPGTPLSELKGVGPKTIEKIEAHGVTTVEKLADMTPEELTAIPGIGEKMVEKIQLAVAGHFQSLEQQQGGGEATPPAELEEQPGEAEQLASEVAVAEEAVAPETSSEEAVSGEVVPEKLDAAAEQHVEAEASEETSPDAAPRQSEASSEEPGASEEENAEQKEKSTGE
jgi:transcription termination/antitermination protein NusA